MRGSAVEATVFILSASSAAGAAAGAVPERGLATAPGDTVSDAD